jgi:hypothetical protein
MYYRAGLLGLPSRWIPGVGYFMGTHPKQLQSFYIFCINNNITPYIVFSKKLGTIWKKICYGRSRQIPCF